MMNRNYSMDTLRTIAVFFVVIVHSAAPYVNRNASSVNFDFWVGNVFDSLVRVCVPIFVMISGYFLLGRKENAGLFYKKRMSRVLIPLVFWTLAYSLYNLLIMIKNHETNYSILLVNIMNGEPFFHMWYLFMIISLYLITPLINAVYDKENESHLKILHFVGICLLVFAIVFRIWNIYFKNHVFFPIWFIRFIGFYILGYTIPRVVKNKSGTGRVILLLSGYLVSCLAIMAATYYTVTSWSDNILYFYAYLSPLVVIGTILLYTLFATVTIKNNVIAKISGLTLGIYLIHAGVFDLMKYFTQLHITGMAIVDLLIYTFVSFGVSLCATWVIQKIPVVKRIV